MIFDQVSEEKMKSPGLNAGRFCPKTRVRDGPIGGRYINLVNLLTMGLKKKTFIARLANDFYYCQGVVFSIRV